MQNMMAMIGIAGGTLCAVADCLLDLKGADNRKLGKDKIIDSKWETMAHFRFPLSIICAMFAVPMYTVGFWALMNRVAGTHETLAWVIKIIFTCGAMGCWLCYRKDRRKKK